MADLYPSSYSTRSHPSYHRHPESVPPQQQYSQINSALVYPPQILSSHHSGSSNGSSEENHEQSTVKSSTEQQQPQKTESKPQATFLTKLYAFVLLLLVQILQLTCFRVPSLLERPENHHMIRWDPAGEHIIVERPEQLALHVLPSIYRQSRFASFSRQLNVCLLLPLPISFHNSSRRSMDSCVKSTCAT